MAEEIVLNVEGMTCDHCVKAVTGALESVPGVEKAIVSLDDKEAKVSGSIIDKAALIAAVEEEGYEAAIA